MVKDNGKEETPKKMVVVQVPQLNLYSIQFQGGGRVPDELSGNYTSITLAQKAIDNYFKRR